MKRIIHITFWIIMCLGTLVLLGFVSNSQGNTECKKVEIHVDYSNGMYFITKEDIEERMKRNHLYPIGLKMSDIDIAGIEENITKLAEIEKAEVYKTIDGTVGVRIAQRKPIVRIINLNGRNFYLDEKGYQMPVSGNYSPRVIVVNGYISEPEVDISAEEIAFDTTLRKSFKTDDVYKMAKFISNDPFWSAQVQEIYFNRYGEMELVPVVGDHRIVFGDTEMMEEKFNKLKLFYREGIKKTGWNQYDTINLKYKNQIVCSKK
ncbi:MAG: cell division protein FtsQ/DivIB [Bacteroidota bacterium]